MKRDPICMKNDMLKTLYSKQDLEETVARLNAALPEGIVIVGMAAPVRKAEAIVKAEYTMLLSGKIDREAYQKLMEQ